MWLELLKQRVNWWNEMVAQLNTQPENKIKIKYLKKYDIGLTTEHIAEIRDISTNIVYVGQRNDYYIELWTEKNELFNKWGLSLISVGYSVAFERVAEAIIKDLIVAGFSNNIYHIRNRELRII